MDEETRIVRAYLCPMVPPAIVLEVGPFEPERWSERDFILLPADDAGRLGWRLVRAGYEGLHIKYEALGRGLT
ncbi:MAG: hypothetical protein H0T79_14210 [Deltaproteobacteria bacterium]|nr:hypothetical protein [Deltaproteobacteria bacterium]